MAVFWYSDPNIQSEFDITYKHKLTSVYKLLQTPSTSSDTNDSDKSTVSEQVSQVHCIRTFFGQTERLLKTTSHLCTEKSATSDATSLSDDVRDKWPLGSTSVTSLFLTNP